MSPQPLGHLGALQVPRKVPVPSARTDDEGRARVSVRRWAVYGQGGPRDVRQPLRGRSGRVRRIADTLRPDRTIRSDARVAGYFAGPEVEHYRRLGERR